jgi:arginyl-tRNA synthetase
MKETIAAIVQKILGADAPVVELSVPDEPAFGHYSTNIAMRLAKQQGRKPMELATELSTTIMTVAPKGFFARVEAAAPGFINFWLSDDAVYEEFAKVAKNERYGASDLGKGSSAIVEYSDVNIAKVMNLGHFRTTIIGASLANILSFSGYRVIKWNYLGDWGTQFGKLIAAYKLWGKKEEVEKNPIEELQKLYVRFHVEAKEHADIERRGQEEFKKLEDGDGENRELWKWFKDESLKEFESTYKILGVDFDVWIGESFYEPQLKAVVEECVQKGIAERSEGAIVVKLDAFDLSPALIEKSDGASLYLTRDIANLRYRLETYHPSKIIYIVGNEQALHFEQLFAIAKLLKLEGAELTHLKHGLVLGEGGKKFSTREGRAVSLASALEKAVGRARSSKRKIPSLRRRKKMRSRRRSASAR